MIAYRKKAPLTLDDLGPTATQDTSAHQFALFERLWNEEIARGTRGGVAVARVVSLRWVGRVGLPARYNNADGCGLDWPAPHLIRADSLRRGQDCSRPYAASRAAGASYTLPARIRVYKLHHDVSRKRASLHSYAALTTAMYRKALRLSSVGISQVSTGRLVNMFSTDAGKSLERVVVMMVPAMIAPIQFFGYLTLIWFQIGWTVFASVGLILLVLPLNISIFRNVLGAYASSQGATDKRVKLINELITGIRIVKFYAWEKPFQAVIEATRERELEWIKKHAYWMFIGMQSVFLQLQGSFKLPPSPHLFWLVMWPTQP